MPHTGTLARGVTCVLTVSLAVAGCGSHGKSATHSRSSPAVSATSSTATPDTTPDPHGPSIAVAPKLTSDGISVLTARTKVKGSATFPIPGGIKAGKTLAIGINCQGPGRLRVQVQPTKISFPLLCEKGKVLPTLNEIQMSKSRATSSLRFTADPEVTWSFAVGWDPNPPEQQ